MHILGESCGRLEHKSPHSLTHTHTPTGHKTLLSTHTLGTTDFPEAEEPEGTGRPHPSHSFSSPINHESPPCHLCPVKELLCNQFGKGRAWVCLAVTDLVGPAALLTQEKESQDRGPGCQGPRLNKSPEPRSLCLTLLVCRLHHTEVGQRSLWIWGGLFTLQGEGCLHREGARSGHLAMRTQSICRPGTV